MAHWQVVLTLPKRLRVYFVHDRRRLKLPSQVAARTLRDCVQSTFGERKAVPGLILCVQTFGSVAHLHPHLHVLMTDGLDVLYCRRARPAAASLSARRSEAEEVDR